MSDTFGRSHDILSHQDTFGVREVGVTHPDVSSHVRLKDNGDIEILSGEGVGLLINRKNRSITLFADHVRFLTKDDDTGMRWNKLAFNPRATTFNEPAFLSVAHDDMYNLYKDTDGYFGE
jgi:hypothetical protein